MNAWEVCGRTPDEFDRRLRGQRRHAPFAALPRDRLPEELWTDWSAILGTPEEVVSQIRAYEAAGIAELSVQWPGVDDIKGLEVLAAEALPHLTAD